MTTNNETPRRVNKRTMVGTAVTIPLLAAGAVFGAGGAFAASGGPTQISQTSATPDEVFESFLKHTDCLEKEGIFEKAPEFKEVADMGKELIFAQPAYSPYLTAREGDPCIDLRVNGL